MLAPPRHAADRDAEGPIVDFYEFTMAASFLAEGLADRPAVFEVSVRRLPPGFGYLIAAGVDDLLDALERFQLDEPTLATLESTGLFDARFLECLAAVRFRGAVRALPEGTVFSERTPLLELRANLLEAQLVETMVLNRLHFPTLVASKAARCVEAAAGRALADFSLRRTHGVEPASTSPAAATSPDSTPRATSTRAAASAFRSRERWDTPTSRPSGTSVPRSPPSCAPSRTVRRSCSTPTTRSRALAVPPRWAGRSRDRAGRSRPCGSTRAISASSAAGTRILDEAGLTGVRIVASGNLDEVAIARLVATGAPIDGFGVGTRLGVSADAPSLDMADKLVVSTGSQ